MMNQSNGRSAPENVRCAADERNVRRTWRRRENAISVWRSCITKHICAPVNDIHNFNEFALREMNILRLLGGVMWM